MCGCLLLGVVLFSFNLEGGLLLETLYSTIKIKVDFTPHNAPLYPPQIIRNAKSSPMKEVGKLRVALQGVYMTIDLK